MRRLRTGGKWRWPASTGASGTATAKQPHGRSPDRPRRWVPLLVTDHSRWAISRSGRDRGGVGRMPSRSRRARCFAGRKLGEARPATAVQCGWSRLAGFGGTSHRVRWAPGRCRRPRRRRGMARLAARRMRRNPTGQGTGRSQYRASGGDARAGSARAQPCTAGTLHAGVVDPGLTRGRIRRCHRLGMGAPDRRTSGESDRPDAVRPAAARNIEAGRRPARWDCTPPAAPAPAAGR